MDGLLGLKRVSDFFTAQLVDLTDKRSEPPSNVTRISRVFRRTCSDGTHQVINYFPGVGTANPIDRFMGGAFGMGLDQVRPLAIPCSQQLLTCTGYP